MDLRTAEISHVLNFATKQAQTIVGLAYVNLAICLLFLLVVVGLVAYVAFRFRYRPGDGEPIQVEGNTRLEVAWTVVPALLFTVLAVGTGLVMQEVNPPVGKRRPDVIVIGHQFWWEYQYPKLGLITANELYLPEGADLMLEVRGADVIHSFWVPDFGQKMDGIPGHPNNLFLQPLRKGLFLGQCSEYCGSQHALMRILANVVPQRDFEAWAGSQAKVPAPPSDEISRHGQSLFMTKTCVQCHNIAGTPAVARVGPDLTHVADRKTLGAGVVENSLENLASWIKNPQNFKPGCYMPNMRLTDKEAHDIAFYLENLK